MNDELQQMAARLGEALLTRGERLAAAESCTGGWIAKVVTDIPGSSGWFDRGFVTYSNEAKQELLGVAAATLDSHGAVSEATVRAMVAGTFAHSRADLALAVSGIAGPGGGSPEKPVGTVWFAWGRRDGALIARRELFAGDRTEVRRQSVLTALQGAMDLL